MKPLAGLLALWLLTGCAGTLAASEADSAAGAAIERGRVLFRDKGCVTCHINQRVEGKTGVLNFGAPNLTSYANDPGFLRRWLANPSAVRAGTAMPNLRLTAVQIEDLIAFLNEPRP